MNKQSGNIEWYTPPALVERARDALREIDLDPASNEYANSWIKAKRIFTKDDDALSKQWEGRVFLNPPYRRGLIGAFADKFREEWFSGRIVSAVVLVNSATEQSWWRTFSICSSCICFPNKRIQFLTLEHNISRNSRPQTIFYCGSLYERFARIFTNYGTLCQRYKE